MNLASFFIGRPIFAAVLSLTIFILGALSMGSLPVSEFPQVVPPTIVVRAIYPGAAPETIADTVAGPLEQQLTGIPGMLYMLSQNTADGAMSLTLTFAIGTRLEDALVEVQNRITQAAPRLPEDVRRLGVTTEKSSGDLTMVVHLTSPDDRYDMLYLSNFARLRVKDELARLPGVGAVRVFGAGEYSLRVWLDPEQLANRSLTPGDVVRAIREQNAQVTAGAIGSQPTPDATAFEMKVTTTGRLSDEAEFAAIVIATGADGQLVHLRDVARVELGADGYSLRSLLSVKRANSDEPEFLNKNAVALPIFQAPGSNAVALSDSVRAQMETLKRSFPPGVDYTIVYDPTVFIRESISAVIHTLLEAVALVVIVVVVFLQTWRAAVIPLLAVPVSIVGTFAVMHLFGYSINALSLFGLVLAIGIVVDDAIVVVENVERNIALGRDPRSATRQAMREVTGPIIATALVLCAVFLPTAFITGLTGRFYQQFAVTIAISTVISAINSLTLSPALAAVLLKGHRGKKDAVQRVIDAVLGWFFTPFNRFFAAASQTYVGGVARALRKSGLSLSIYGGLLVLTWYGFSSTPTSFVPAQDKGYLIAFAQLPDGASLERTDQVIRQMSQIALQNPAVDGAVAFPGLSINGFTNTSNAGVVFVRLKPFHERHGADGTGTAVANDLTGRFYMGIKEAFVLALQPPPILGMGTSNGFRLFVEDRSAKGLVELKAKVDAALDLARKTGLIDPARTFSTATLGVPKVAVDIDREQIKAMDLPLNAVYDALQGYLGSVYANDFNRFGRTYQVTVQAEAAARQTPEDISRLQMRTASGAMAPLSTVLIARETSGPERVMHYNGFPALDINGGAATGVSGDQARDAMAAVLTQALPSGYAFEWTETVYQQILAGNSAVYIFPLCILLVFLVLAAQYESWTLPLVVILIVPMCLLTALIAVRIAGQDNNVMVQIGFIVLVGLACKNAILIVEFARDAELRGVPLVRATLEACKLRLRPILMTSLAFIMGVVPLVIATGAGAELRRAMGVAVFGGMLGVTIMGLALTPVFYLVIRTLSGRRLSAATTEPGA